MQVPHGLLAIAGGREARFECRARPVDGRLPSVAVLLTVGVVAGGILAGCAGAKPPSLLDGGSCAPAPGCPTQSCCTAESLCQSAVCEGKEYVCTVRSSGHGWEERTAAVRCDDGDPCTKNDQCVSGKCLGAPLDCSSAPPATCADDKTLRTFGASGACRAGTCEYPPSDTPCPQGCQGGQCTGSPCLGVKCDKPPSSCHTTPGTCTSGECTYTPLPANSPCQGTDVCAATGTCDAQGKCVTTGLSCTAANATGSCVNGACQYTCAAGWANCNNSWADGCEANLSQSGNCGSCGKSCTAANATGSCVSAACQYSCAAGWGNCNNNWADGCETALTTTTNCGTCGKTCSGASHATAACSGSSCTVTCVAPYQACDGNAANGCEIPVGVANKCDAGGLNSTTGCGTAYCGSSSRSGARNFGTWTCVFCEHCHHFSNGYSWCLSSNGEFSPDRCSTCCGATQQDHVCPK